MERIIPLRGGVMTITPWRSASKALSYGIDKAFIGGEHAPKILDQIVEQLDVMGASRQERKMGNHPAASDPQAQLEPIIAQLSGRTVTIIGLLLKAAISPTADADKTRATARPNGTAWQVAEPAPAASKRLKDLKIKAPPPLPDIA